MNKGATAGFLRRTGAGADAVALTLTDEPTQMVQVSAIKRVPGLNPRGTMTGESAFEGQGFEDLKASIQQHGGLLQPLILRPDPRRSGEYQLVVGERRWRAVVDLGFVKVLAIVKDLNDQETEVVVRHENELRESVADIDHKVSMLKAIARDAGVAPPDLLPIFVRLRNKTDEAWAEGSVEALTLESMTRLGAPSLATLVGRWSNFLNFTPAECEALARKRVSQGVIIALSKLPPDTDPGVRERLLSEAIAGQWTSTEMVRAIKALKARPVKPERARAAALAETREQIKAMLSKDALKGLTPDVQEELLAQIQALIKQTTGS